MTIAETFIHFVKLLDFNTKNLFDEREVYLIVQILIVWLIEKRYHSIYINEMLGFFSNLLKNKMSQLLVATLVRLNTIALINELYFSICMDGTAFSKLNTEQILVFIKDLVV